MTGTRSSCKIIEFNPRTLFVQIIHVLHVFIDLVACLVRCVDWAANDGRKPASPN
jgi:hypothetical protein